MLRSVNQDLQLRARFAVEDERVSELHARAFGYRGKVVQPWASRLERHSLTWVGAFMGDRLIGFVHACWNGGAHAFLLDTIVDPEFQRLGVGQRLVKSLIVEVRAAGCEWLHVDYEPHLDTFYRAACGFRSTDAGILNVTT